MMAYMLCVSAMMLPVISVLEWVLVEARKGDLAEDWWKCFVSVQRQTLDSLESVLFEIPSFSDSNGVGRISGRAPRETSHSIRCLCWSNAELHWIDASAKQKLPGVLVAMLLQACLLGWLTIIMYQRACAQTATRRRGFAIWDST